MLFILASEYALFLTAHEGNTVQNMLEQRSGEGIFRVRYCPRAQSITHLLHARLSYQHLFSIFLVHTRGLSPVHIV